MQGRSSWVVAWAVFVLGTSPAFAAAQRATGHDSAPAAPESDYDELIRGALTEFDAHNFAEARALFEQAHALKPNARTLRGLGITAFELKRYVEAIDELEAALADTRKPLTDVQRKELPPLIAQARRFVGRVKIEVTPRDAGIVVDGEAVEGSDLTLNLGAHQVLVHAPGYRSAELNFAVDGGENTTKHVELARVDLDVNPESVAPAAGSGTGAGIAQQDRADSAEGGTIFGKWWFWTAAGVVLAGAAVGTAVALSGNDGGSQPLYRGNARSVTAP